MKETLLQVDNFTLSFHMYGQGLRRQDLTVISGLSMSLREGEVLAVVGSSGSGKSLMATAIMGLLPRNAETDGEIRYRGQPVTEKLLKPLRGREIVYVPQSVNNLDPRMKVGRQVQGIYGTREQVREVFRRYELSEDVEAMYPFQLSGGMARRVLISMAVMHEAKMVIADEPTPGMSLDMAAETLRHFRRMADDGAGVLLITHDIDLAMLAADRVAVFYAGTIVEIAPREDFTGEGESLRHPYTRALWRALPQSHFEPIAGRQPYAGTVTEGCRFADRCPMAEEACHEDVPLRELRGGEVRCRRAV